MAINIIKLEDEPATMALPIPLPSSAWYVTTLLHIAKPSADYKNHQEARHELTVPSRQIYPASLRVSFPQNRGISSN